MGRLVDSNTRWQQHWVVALGGKQNVAAVGQQLCYAGQCWTPLRGHGKLPHHQVLLQSELCCMMLWC